MKTYDTSDRVPPGEAPRFDEIEQLTRHAEELYGRGDLHAGECVVREIQAARAERAAWFRANPPGPNLFDALCAAWVKAEKTYKPFPMIPGRE